MIDQKTSCHKLGPQRLEGWVLNLMNLSLTPAQEEVLRLGLNCAPVPTKLPLGDIATAVEEGARQLNDSDAEEL